MNYVNMIWSFVSQLSLTEWSGVIAAFVLAFDRLAKITPTNSDNAIVEWMYKIFAVLGVKVQDNTGK